MAASKRNVCLWVCFLPDILTVFVVSFRVQREEDMFSGKEEVNSYWLLGKKQSNAGRVLRVCISV